MDALHAFFSRLYQFDELIRWGGYAVLIAIVFAETGLLAGFFLPGDSLLVTAGLVAAGTGTLHVGWLILLLSIAAIVGDSTGYAIGYHLGARLYRCRESCFFRQEHLRKAHAFYERHGAKTIVLARFVPIVRTFAPTVAGAAQMRYATFLTYNVLGGAGWVTGMLLAGFWLGRAIPHIDKQVHWVILVVIVLSFLPILHEWRRSRGLRNSHGSSGSGPE